MIETIEFTPMEPVDFDISCKYPEEIMLEKPDLLDGMHPLFVRYIELHKQIDILIEERYKFLLDITKNKFTKEINKLEAELREVEKSMNKDLSPYFWMCTIGEDKHKWIKRPRNHYIFYLDKLNGE